MALEAMTGDVKKVLGINHTDFDTIIDNYVKSGLKDLKQAGLIATTVVQSDPLIYSAVMSYCLSLLDTQNAELYANAYRLQKDELRHFAEYVVEAGNNGV